MQNAELSPYVPFSCLSLQADNRGEPGVMGFPGQRVGSLLYSFKGG